MLSRAREEKLCKKVAKDRKNGQVGSYVTVWSLAKAFSFDGRVRAGTQLDLKEVLFGTHKLSTALPVMQSSGGTTKEKETKSWPP